MDYKQKYLKYKSKYLNLKNLSQLSGSSQTDKGLVKEKEIKIILGGLQLTSNCNNEVLSLKKRWFLYNIKPYKNFKIPSPPYSESKNIKCNPLNDIGIDYDKLKVTIDSSLKYINSGSFNHTYDISYKNDDGVNKKLVLRIMKDKIEDIYLGKRRKLTLRESLQTSEMEQKGLLYQALLSKSKTEGGYECPNICKVYDFGIYTVKDSRKAKRIFQTEPIDDTNYFKTTGIYAIIEKLEGGDLKNRINKHKYTIEEIKMLSINILEALNCMHSNGILHLDLKPDNIMMVSEDNHTNIKLIDFGMSTSKDKDGFIKINSIRGTPGYISPNIINQYDRLSGKMEGLINGKDDIWSFAIILMEVLLQKPGTIYYSFLERLIETDYAFCLKPKISSWSQIEKEFSNENKEDIDELIIFLKSIFEPEGRIFMGDQISFMTKEKKLNLDDQIFWSKIPSAKQLLNNNFLKKTFTEKYVSVKDIKLFSD